MSILHDPYRALQNADIRAHAGAGRVVGERALRQRVFSSGIEPDVRREAWKFLLGLYPWDSTAAERAALLRAKQRQYGQLKAQWASILPQQAARCAPPAPFGAFLDCYRGKPTPVVCRAHQALISELGALLRLSPSSLMLCVCLCLFSHVCPMSSMPADAFPASLLGRCRRAMLLR